MVVYFLILVLDEFSYFSSLYSIGARPFYVIASLNQHLVNASPSEHKASVGETTRKRVVLVWDCF